MKMAKTFNVTAVCIPEEHYMVRLDDRLREIKDLIDAGKYFSINRARQYGKSTLLMALEQYLQRDYRVVSLDFQTFDDAKFQNGCKAYTTIICAVPSRSKSYHWLLLRLL